MSFLNIEGYNFIFSCKFLPGLDCDREGHVTIVTLRTLQSHIGYPGPDITLLSSKLTLETALSLAGPVL